MHIAFITDFHIGNRHSDNLLRDTRKQLLNTIEKLQNETLDFIVLGGDLCDHGNELETYEWVRDSFKSFRQPILPISGNHDNSTLLAEAFELNHHLQGEEVFYTHPMGEKSAIFLDTSKGRMTESQWVWLERKLADSGDKVYIFMHHPPIFSGSRHMEPKYMFTQISEFEALLQKHNTKEFYVFCGHYHLERVITKANLHLFISPSTYLQIDPETNQFQAMNDYYGYRMIYIHDDLVSSSVIYV